MATDGERDRSTAAGGRTAGDEASHRGSTTLRKESTSTSSIVRDAKGLALDLKSMLKRKDPWDREVEFQRQSLRKAYLQIIFTSINLPSSGSALPPKPTSSTTTTHATRALDALGLLWLETTHALIHLYRAKLAEMDKAIAEAPQAHRRGRRDGGGNGGAMIPPVGPTARRKLIHSFRTFLGQEEDFFRVLLGRLAGNLLPPDWAGLRPLGVVVDQDDPQLVAAQVQRSEEEKKNDRSRSVPLAHKALICFGDLARYRELYNEAGSKKETVNGGGERERGKKGKKDASEKKQKNWKKAAECYHQARLLMPDNGNPSNQLAVLSQYAGDPLSSTYHYYRALCVRQPFSTARTNLDISYSKAVARWFAEGGGDHAADADAGSRFRLAFVALQGLYFTRTRVRDIAGLSQHTEALFEEAVQHRLLTSDIVVKVVITSLCALWQARLFRSNKKSSSERPVDAPASPTVDLEPHILVHVLSFYRILLTIGSAETRELYTANSSAEEEIPLAQYISAVLRRTLPALRILSKWIMGQLEYIKRVEARVEMKERKEATPTEGGPQISSAQLHQTLEDFWTTFADFNNAIKLAFPLEDLPSAREGGVWLEEDVDLLGFAPLRRGMKEGVAAADGTPAEVSTVGQEVHPNDEQLMRIAELQADAQLIANSGTSLLSLDEGAFVFDAQPDELTPEGLEAREVALAAQRIDRAFNGEPSDRMLRQVDEIVFEEDELGEELAEQDAAGDHATEDDPVDLAMRIGEADHMDMDDDGEDDDDDDEQIVYAGNLSMGDLSGSTSAGGHAIPAGVSSAFPSAQYAGVPLGTSPVSRSIWADQLQRPTAATGGSFESLPNLSHQAFQPHNAAAPVAAASIWANAGHSNAVNNAVPLQSTPAVQASSLFGSFSPFAPAPTSSSSSSSPSRPSPLAVGSLPVPTLSRQASGMQGPGLSPPKPHSDLSASAAAFISRSPQRGSPFGSPLVKSAQAPADQRQHGFS